MYFFKAYRMCKEVCVYTVVPSVNHSGDATGAPYSPDLTTPLSLSLSLSLSLCQELELASPVATLCLSTRALFTESYQSR